MSTELPPWIASAIPSGSYLCEIKSEVTRRKSNWPGGKDYFELVLIVQLQTGDYAEIPFNFTQKSEALRKLHLFLGGEELPSGVLSTIGTPYVGRKFEAKIKKRPKKTKPDEDINEIVDIRACPKEKEKIKFPKQDAIEEASQAEEKEIEPEDGDGDDEIPW